MSLIELAGVSRTVLLPDERTLTVLDGVDVRVDAGEHIAVIGRSGSGKSTLLNIVGLLDLPTDGQYMFDGSDVARLSDRRRARLRGRSFGFVFQQFNLLPRRSALDNVAAPMLYASGREFWQRRRIAAQMLERVGLDDRLDATPDKLSGGEQQRVAIARSLVRNPRVILSDEPTGALDVETGQDIMAMLDDIASESEATLITITHDLAVAARATRHCKLDHGRLSAVDLDVLRQQVLEPTL